MLQWLRSNAVSIMLALLLALAVWIVATQEENPAESAEFSPIPVEIIEPAAGYVITNTPASAVTIQLRAPRTQLRLLSGANFVVTVDASGYGAGIHNIPVSATIINADAILESVNPSTIRVVIEEILVRSDIPIQLAVSGNLPTGYSAGTNVIEPLTVTITGPRSRVELVGEIQASVSIANLREPLEQTVQLRALDNDGNPIGDVSILPATAQISIPIFQEADFKQLAVRVVADIQPAPGYYVTNIIADPPLVSVRGDPDVLSTLATIETQSINLEGVRENTSFIAQLAPPEGVTLEDVQTVTVLFAVEAIPGFVALEVPIRYSGLNEELTVTIFPGNVVMSLSGPQPILDMIDDQEDIIVHVDLTDLVPGRYQIEPEYEISSEEINAEDLARITIESVLPTLVEVVIEENAEEAP
nr:hypothetical protein [Anaerolineae bacterium]